MENRKTGRTTKLINKYIKDMIDNPGLLYRITDHYNDVHNNSIMVKRIEHRLQNEYPNMIDIYHTMDNYGATASGANTMCVRYSSYVLLDKDIFIGRVVDEVIESLFHNMNKPVNILESVQDVYKDNSKILFPKLNSDFCDKVIKHTSDRLKYEHCINVDNCLSSEYDISKEPVICENNRYFARYFVMTLYSPDFLEDKLSLKTNIDNLDIFKEYTEIIDTCDTKDISATSGNDWIKLSSNDNLTNNISNSICTISADTNTISNSIIGELEELKRMVDELKNKDKYKTPKYEEFNLFSSNI